MISYAGSLGSRNRLFEACTDPEDGAGGKGCLSNIHLFQTIHFLNMLWVHVPPRIQKGGGQRGPTLATFLVAEGRENRNTT